MRRSRAIGNSAHAHSDSRYATYFFGLSCLVKSQRVDVDMKTNLCVPKKSPSFAVVGVESEEMAKRVGKNMHYSSMGTCFRRADTVVQRNLPGFLRLRLNSQSESSTRDLNSDSALALLQLDGSYRFPWRTWRHCEDGRSLVQTPVRCFI